MLPLCMDQYMIYYISNIIWKIIQWNRDPFLVNESLRIRDPELLFGLQKSLL